MESSVKSKVKSCGFHEIQSFLRILLNPSNPIGFQWNQQYFMKFTDIIGFHVIQQISTTPFTRISLWISFANFILDFIWNLPKTVRHLTLMRYFYWFQVDFTKSAFTVVFIMDFTTNFLLNPPDFIINFITNFITYTRISLKSTIFNEIHSISQDFTEINRISSWISL